MCRSIFRSVTSFRYEDDKCAEKLPGLLDRRFEKVFRSFFGESNGELSMVKESLDRLREIAGRGLLQGVPYLREVVKLTAD